MVQVLGRFLSEQFVQSFRKCAFIRNDVASVRIDNSIMAFAVNFVCANQIFLNDCFPSLEVFSIPVLRLSLQTQTALIRDQFS